MFSQYRHYAFKLIKILTFSVCLTGGLHAAETNLLDVEKDELKFGFIKLTDMAPLAIAYEKGYFEDEGLYVTLEPQANYGITVSNEIWEEMKQYVPMDDSGKPVHPISASALKPVVDRFNDEGKPFNMGMVFPVSTHNYELRYWLAAGGIHPGFYSPTDVSGQIDAEALLSVTPPPQMPATLEAGTIYGYCVGEPWNQQAVFKGIGVPVITDYQIWKNNPEKVFGLTKEFTEENPNTTLALTKALIRAAKWLDEGDNANRLEAVEILARSEYVGADAEVIANSMTGTFEFEKGDKREIPDFNVFYRYFATYPYYSDAIWYLSQMRRWGQIEEYKADEWYAEMNALLQKFDVPVTSDSAEVLDSKNGTARKVWTGPDKKLLGVCLSSREPVLADRNWLITQANLLFADDDPVKSDGTPAPATITQLLAGYPSSGDQSSGAMVCACNSVGRNSIIKCIKDGNTDIKTIGKLTKAGTGCGSCQPELQSLLFKQLLEDENNTEFTDVNQSQADNRPYANPLQRTG